MVKFKRNAVIPAAERSVVRDINHGERRQQGRHGPVLPTLNTPSSSFSIPDIDYTGPTRMDIDDEADNEMMIDQLDKVDDKPPTAKEKQWVTWRDRVMPLLVSTYGELLGKTEGLSQLHRVKREEVRCSGCIRGQAIPLKVLCLYFDHGFRESSLLLYWGYTDTL